MFPPQRLALAVYAALLAATLAGCSDPLIDRISALAEPTGARKSKDEQLRKLIAAVEQAQGLPLQLEKPLGQSDDNAAAALADCYSNELHLQAGSLVEPLIDPSVEDTARADFLKRRQRLVEKTAAAVDLPRCRFDVGHEYGFFARMTYLDDASLAARLLLVRSLLFGAEKDSGAALADLLRAFRITHWLAQVDRVEARVLAATLRAEAFEVAKAQLHKGVLLRHGAEQLYAAIRDQLTDWPSDQRMLIGERATVIHAYEAIRAGMIGRLVTLDERRRLQSNGRMTGLETASDNVIDADEARYLQAMERLLGVANQPYYERRTALDDASAVINSAPTLFASTLFSKDLFPSIRLAAEDRSVTEAWTIALAAAGDLRTPPYRDCPVTGEPYLLEREAGFVTVSLGDEPVVTLPILAQ